MFLCELEPVQPVASDALFVIQFIVKLVVVIAVILASTSTEPEPPDDVCP